MKTGICKNCRGDIMLHRTFNSIGDRLTERWRHTFIRLNHNCRAEPMTGVLFVKEERCLALTQQ